MNRDLLLVFAQIVIVSTMTTSLAQTASGQSRGVPARISDALVETLLSLAKLRQSNTLLGMSKYVGTSLALGISSNRSLIAWRNAAAAEQGGRFAPPAEMRPDIVIVNCGDSDLGDIFECERVTVTGAKGGRVIPIAYQAGPSAYKNALGARWSVREVRATYHVRDLRDGFNVTFRGVDQTEWMLPVSPEEAESELLLGLAPGVPVDPSVSSGQNPPPKLDLGIERLGDTWRIENRSPGFAWQQCEAAADQSVAKLPRLAPSSSVILRRSDFRPPLSAQEPSPLWVSCQAKGEKFIVIERP